MPNHSIYEDIAARTGGEIYIGVVGPVRSGKSTFIKRFMESLVLPNLREGYDRNRARDEMPQSAAGRTVMTTEPKFVPDEAVPVRLDESTEVRVRLVDCVGYLVRDVMGTVEDGQPRMVRTPWSAEPMPFCEAAEMGTHKVITDHSTIGMVVTTDGTVGDLPRENYEEAEERVVAELKEMGKPFALILNSATPSSEKAVALAYELEKKYGVPVALVSCLDLDAEDIRHILELVLNEFPVASVDVRLPEWMSALDNTHPVRAGILSSIRACAAAVHKTGDIRAAFGGLGDCEYLRSVGIDEINLGTGCATVSVTARDGLYYEVISELTGFDIAGEEQLITLLRDLSEMKQKYDKVAEALDAADKNGYGIVMPEVGDLKLETPEMIRQAGGYGVRLRAKAQSIHMIRADIETEINPIVGTEQQSEDMIKYLMQSFEKDPSALWQSNMFGKSLYELVNDGLHSKLEHMPEESRAKLSETLERIINEGSGGLICILL